MIPRKIKLIIPDGVKETDPLVMTAGDYKALVDTISDIVDCLRTMAQGNGSVKGEQDGKTREIGGRNQRDGRRPTKGRKDRRPEGANTGHIPNKPAMHKLWPRVGKKNQ